jgi:hypothetical protein
MNTALSPAPLPRYVDRSTDRFESYKDWRERLQHCIRGYSWEETRNLFNTGSIGEREWTAYTRLWHFMNYRLSSPIQDSFWAQMGQEATARKINRHRAAFGFGPVS